jgi:hypothetical protein
MSPRPSSAAAAFLAFTAGVVLPAFAIGGHGIAGCAAVDGSGLANVSSPSILFIKRVTTVTNGSSAPIIDVAGGNGTVVDYARYEPGGSLDVLTPPQVDGTVTNLTADFPTADFNGADVSFDATMAAFSMKKDANDTYHIYTVSLTPAASGKYVIHQLTAGAQDDINPVFLPGQVIAFVTNQMYTPMGTRSDEYEHARAATQLATITVSGGDADRFLFPQSLSHAMSPFARHDGSVGYSRWEHLGGTNDVKLFGASPDGTMVVALAGEHGKPANSLVSVRESAPNEMIGVATSRECTIHAGALVQIDARNQSDPVCLDGSADQTGHACLDEQHAKFTVLTPAVPTNSDPSPVGRYREPSVLPDGRILTSWADGYVNDLDELAATPPDFGIYVFDPATQANELVYNDRTTWDLNALPVVARAEPPVFASPPSDAGATAPVLLGSIDITQTSLDETVHGAEFGPGLPLESALGQAVGVRVIEGFSSEATPGATWFGLTMDEGAAILGTAPVYSDGSWLAKVPPYLPVRVQPIDKFGLAIRTERLWIQGAPGEDRRCVGCHESRTGQGVPALTTSPTLAEQATAADFTETTARRTELPWQGAPDAGANVQTLLTAKCAGCHNATTSAYYEVPTGAVADGGRPLYYRIPTLDLSDSPVTVYYDTTIATWPASYVSIFYPALLRMGGSGGEVAVGSVPPLWGIPEDARDSDLIKTINLRATDGTTAWPGPLHPEDQGQGYSLTDDERQMLVRTIDLGGQFWTRQNSGFTPFPHDPTPGQ